MDETTHVGTFLQAARQDGSVSEDDGVKGSLAGGVEGPVQADVTAGLPATAVLAVHVAMDPGEQHVQTGSHSPAGGRQRLEQHDECLLKQVEEMNSRHRDELGSCHEASQVPGSSLAEDGGLGGVLQDLPQVIQEGFSQSLRQGTQVITLQTSITCSEHIH